VVVVPPVLVVVPVEVPVEVPVVVLDVVVEVVEVVVVVSVHSTAVSLVSSSHSSSPHPTVMKAHNARLSAVLLIPNISLFPCKRGTCKPVPSLRLNDEASINPCPPAVMKLLRVH